MSHQVLARQYRPKNFSSLMGQEHVSKALGNALTSGRLHHAYLFSGTRGVGKTTIARLLAKALNCEAGTSNEPCGQCDSCIEIDEGRHLDLIEVDAASKTKVEDTRELLDNIQYASSRGRYKIYLIDEVHMLSGHSFNALLKTLEEPPEHVKFLLATTDPQKLPITILSRCLKFNLKRLSEKQILQQLEFVLDQEKIKYESNALVPIAIAADGSMRDGLSLLDQAISYDGESIKAGTVDSMLGNISSTQMDSIFTALLNKDAEDLIRAVHESLNLGVEASHILSELINQLQQLAMLKFVPNVVAESSVKLSSFMLQISKQFNDEDLQLYYQIALHGHKDMQISPFPNGALEMTFLRMLTFSPSTSHIDMQTQHTNREKKNTIISAAEPISSQASNSSTLNEVLLKNKESTSSNMTKEMGITNPDENIREVSNTTQAQQIVENNQLLPSHYSSSSENENSVQLPQEPQHNPELEKQLDQQNLLETDRVNGTSSIIEATIQVKPDISSKQYVLQTQEDLSNSWYSLVQKINCSGFEKELLSHCYLSAISNINDVVDISLGVDIKHHHLLDDKTQKRLLELVRTYYIDNHGLNNVKLKYSLREEKIIQESDTPRQMDDAKKEALKIETENAIYSDETLNKIIEKFSGKIIHSSIHPLSNG